MTRPFEAARDHFLQGVALLEAGDNVAAEAALQASLALLPGRPSTLVNLGAVRLRLGRPAEAITALDEALAADDQQADAWCHRALACSELGRDSEALASLQRAFALGCTLASARQHQALVLNRLGRHAEALAVLQALLLAEPAHAGAQLLLGQTLQTLHRLPEARSAYEAAVALAPQLPDAWMHLGLLLNDLGDAPAAQQALQRARQAGGDAPLLAYFSAAVGHGAPQSSAPPQYVRALFDPYAAGFEQHLVDELRYCGHEAVVNAAATWCTWDTRHGGRAALALDLGCGSGLCGALLRTRAQRVEGVDLSPTMVAQARAGGSYDAVHEADIVQHLLSRSDRADVVVAADVFIYIGDLAQVFAAVAGVLAPGGVFAFTVEQEEGPAAYVLRRSLRYAHSEAGLRALAAAHGLVVRQARPLVLREEQRLPVAGLVLVLQLAG